MKKALTRDRNSIEQPWQTVCQHRWQTTLACLNRPMPAIGDVDDTQKYTDPCDSHLGTIFALISYKFSFVIGALSQLVVSALDERSLHESTE